MCREINEWLNGLLKEQLERDVKNDHAGNKATEEINMLNDELKIVNENNTTALHFRTWKPVALS